MYVIGRILFPKYHDRHVYQSPKRIQRRCKCSETYYDVRRTTHYGQVENKRLFGYGNIINFKTEMELDHLCLYIIVISFQNIQKYYGLHEETRTIFPEGV